MQAATNTRKQLSHALTQPLHTVSAHSTWPAGRNQSRCATAVILTWPADVLNLQVFVGCRARVAKEAVRC